MGKFSKLAKDSRKKNDKLYFVFTDGKYTGGKFNVPFGGSLTLGRDITSDVAVVDEKVSRTHAEIRSRDKTAVIVDLNSTNGTLFNGEKLPGKNPRELTPGDRISIGASTFEFLGNDPEKNPERNISPAEKKQKKEEEEEVSLEIDADAELDVSVEPVEDDSPSKKNTDETDDNDDREPGEFFFDENIEKPATEVITNNRKKPADPPPSDKQSVGRVRLKKKDIRRSQTIPDNTLEAGSGRFEDVSPVNLLSLLLQSDSSGVLTAEVTSPFEEKIEVKIGRDGCVAARSLTNTDFSEEKAFARLILSERGDYSFDTSIRLGTSEVNTLLEDMLMETASKEDILAEYRTLLKQNTLTFRIPLQGILSELDKKQLAALQFMVNAQEIKVYLDMTPDRDDLFLISEIKKYMDKGLLQEPRSDKKIETVDEDEIFDM